MSRLAPPHLLTGLVSLCPLHLRGMSTPVPSSLGDRLWFPHSSRPRIIGMPHPAHSEIAANRKSPLRGSGTVGRGLPGGLPFSPPKCPCCHPCAPRGPACRRYPECSGEPHPHPAGPSRGNRERWPQRQGVTTAVTARRRATRPPAPLTPRAPASSTSRGLLWAGRCWECWGGERPAKLGACLAVRCSVTGGAQGALTTGPVPTQPV